MAVTTYSVVGVFPLFCGKCQGYFRSLSPLCVLPVPLSNSAPCWFTQASAAGLISIGNRAGFAPQLFFSSPNKDSKETFFFPQVVRDYNLQLFLQENSVFHKPQPFQFQPSDSDTVRALCIPAVTCSCSILKQIVLNGEENHWYPSLV